MSDSAQLFALLLTVLLPIAGLILLGELALRKSGRLSAFSDGIIQRFWEAWDRARIRATGRRWLTGRDANLIAKVAPEDARALFLHDVELGTGRSLLVTFEKNVYVTPRQRRVLGRYLRHSDRGRSVERVFAQHGYRLYTTSKR